MKSIKPGRGPSGMSFIGSVVAIIFGIFWTIMAFSMTAGSPVGIIFPLFGIIFIIVGIIQAVYHYKNATSENRFSEFDITDSSEEGDPLDEFIKREADGNYCPYCGTTIKTDYDFCPKCGKNIRGINKNEK